MLTRTLEDRSLQSMSHEPKDVHGSHSARHLLQSLSPPRISPIISAENVQVTGGELTYVHGNQNITVQEGFTGSSRVGELVRIHHSDIHPTTKCSSFAFQVLHSQISSHLVQHTTRANAARPQSVMLGLGSLR
jgi:hypothetical protein